MSITIAADLAQEAGTSLAASNRLQQRLAEAANYAVLRRVAPVLRHDVAGFMQPVGMLMMVLQRRVQMPEPDLQTIAKNVASLSLLTKDATAGSMNAMGWLESREDPRVSLHSSVDEAAKLLAMELSSVGLEISNAVSDEAATVAQSFFRSVVLGALLAFCDQRTAGSTVQVSVEMASENDRGGSRLMLRMLPGGAATVSTTADSARKIRSIDWQDVEAMAGFVGMSLTRGEGWLAVDLP